MKKNLKPIKIKASEQIILSSISILEPSTNEHGVPLCILHSPMKDTALTTDQNSPIPEN